ncbi:MAG: transposase, partial [Chloroflexia bacterium]|nr:transposase [Chloroflexia bacterium]
MIGINERRDMIEPEDADLSIVEQCKLLELPRSTLYYTASKAYSDHDLEIMKALDTLHLEDPTCGTRRMRLELAKLGYQVGRRHVRTLMQLMRLKTVYCRPRTTVTDPAKYKYPYLLRNLVIDRPNQA